MSLLGDLGGIAGAIGGPLATTPINILHWGEDQFDRAGDWFGQRTPALKIDHNLNVDLKNFRMNIDTKDIANAHVAAMGAIETGLTNLGNSISSGLNAFGQDIKQGFEDMSKAVASLAPAMERSAASFAKSIGITVQEASSSLQSAVALIGDALENLDVSGGLGRHIMSTIKYAQASGASLKSLAYYFSRLNGEQTAFNYVMKVDNLSDRYYHGYQQRANITINGIGGTDANASKTISILVAPDLKSDHAYDFKGSTTIKLGPPTKTFGIPYISKIELSSVPSELDVRVQELAALLIGADKLQDNFLRIAAVEELARLGPYALPLIEPLKEESKVAEPFLGQALQTAIREITSYAPKIGATILMSCSISAKTVGSDTMISCGSFMEPISFLCQRLPSALHMLSATKTPVTEKTLITEHTEKTKKHNNWRLSLLNDSVYNPSMITPKNGALVPLLDRELASYGQSFGTVMDDLVELGNKLTNFQSPVHYGGLEGIRGLAWDFLGPIIESLEEANYKYKKIARNYKPRFQKYQTSTRRDPGLTHLIGFKVLEIVANRLPVTINFLATNLQTGDTMHQSVQLSLDALAGEALVCVPLRSLNADPHRVRIEAELALEYDSLITHYEGLLGKFTRVDSQSRVIEFEVERLF